MEERYQLDGGAFVPLGPFTAEHDAWLMGLLHRAGLDRIEIKRSESPDRFARRLLGEILSSGSAFEVLGGLYVREGESWSPQKAEENAAFFKQLTGEEDKASLWEMLALAFAGFFESGLISLRSSSRFSNAIRPFGPRPMRRWWQRILGFGIGSSGRSRGPITRRPSAPSDPGLSALRS